MPLVTESALREMLTRIYHAKGTSVEEAEIVARHQVEANLVGHDSHGITRTRKYVDLIDKGHLVPGAPYEIEQSSDTSAVVNGNWGFGFVVTERAMTETIEKAKASGVAMASVRYQGHVGRLGAYAAMAAREGMIAMIMADSGLGPKFVTPYGGSASRLGTNPICFGAPGGSQGPVILDMATSAVAAGKIHVARDRGTPIPSTWILDKNGQATTNPADYYDGGTILPLGGDQGHKGYGLSFIVEMFCGLLTGLGFGIDPQGRHNDGIFLSVFDIKRLQDPRRFDELMADFIAYLKDTPLAEGFDEILYPGELETRLADARRADGIQIDDGEWADIVALTRELGVADG